MCEGEFPIFTVVQRSMDIPINSLSTVPKSVGVSTNTFNTASPSLVLPDNALVEVVVTNADGCSDCFVNHSCKSIDGSIPSQVHKPFARGKINGHQ